MLADDGGRSLERKELGPEPTPSPSGASSSVLDGVSCSSANACTGVGDYLEQSGDQLTLAERWNGAKWVRATPSPPSGFRYDALNGVACSSSRVCMAVGSLNINATLAEHWNGIRWVVQSTPNPSNAGQSELAGLSCSSPRFAPPSAITTTAPV